ncbi:carboxylesterase family protein [Pseudonocardia sichuanensis]
MLTDEAVSAHSPVYAYEFAEPTGESPRASAHGARHGVDIPNFFDSYRQQPTPKAADEVWLDETLIGCWTSFAGTGEPGGGWTVAQPARAHSISVAHRPGGRGCRQPLRVLAFCGRLRTPGRFTTGERNTRVLDT